MSPGQKKRQQRKIAAKGVKINNTKREILFRKFNNSEPVMPEIESEPKQPDSIFPEFDESIIADWHAHYARMNNLLFLKF